LVSTSSIHYAVIVASQKLSRAASRIVRPDDVLTVGEAAVLLRCSRQHVYGLIERGELRAHRIGEDGPLRVTLSALRRVVQEV
jgi:excisionase family DNA binding protein